MELGNFSISLNVKDIGASRVFYETLGFSVIAGDAEQNWLIMKNGDANIGLFQGMFEKNILTFNPGWDQNGRELKTFTDIRAIQKKLKEAGISFEQEAKDGTEPASFVILDPDGNPILVDQHVESPGLRVVLIAHHTSLPLIVPVTSRFSGTFSKQDSGNGCDRHRENMAQTDNIPQQSAEASVENRPQNAVKPARRQRLLQLLASNWLLCLLVFGVALVFDLHNLGTPSIWFDEAFSVELARQPLPLLWHIIWGPEPNMELYYLFLHFWLGLTGLLGFNPVEALVRLPSAIFAGLASVMVFLLGRRYLGLVAGIAGAGLFTFNYLQLTYAQQTRAYSLQLLLTCIAWYALFAIFTGEMHTKRWWACFIIANTLAVYAHLFSTLIILAQVVTFAGLLVLPGPWRVIARRRLRPFIASLLLIGVLIIPMLLESLRGPKTGWLPIPHLHELVVLFQLITTSSNLYLLILFVLCFCAVLLALLPHVPDTAPLLQSVTFYRSGDQQSEHHIQQLLPMAFALVCWFFVPIISSFIVSQGSIRLFSTRYLVTVLSPLFLLVGLAVVALRWRGAQFALIAGLFLIALSLVPVYYRSAQVEDWNSTVHWLEQRSQPSDGLVCFDNDVQQGCQIAVEYYLHAYPNGTHFTSDSPGAFSWENFGPVDPATDSSAAVDPHALALYAAQHPRLFYIVGRVPTDVAAKQAQVAQQWLDSHYHLLGRIHTPTVTISWYATS